MKKIRNMTLTELAAYVQTHLRAEGIEVVLSGGATVSLYSGNKYVSKDADLINVRFAKRSKVRAAMEKIGFGRRDGTSLIPTRNFSLNFPTVRFR